jgi:hypothetical protein
MNTKIIIDCNKEASMELLELLSFIKDSCEDGHSISFRDLNGDDDLYHIDGDGGSNINKITLEVK